MRNQMKRTLVREQLRKDAIAHVIQTVLSLWFIFIDNLTTVRYNLSNNC